jgi:peptide/nickel transport system substrate-binding protein
MMIWRTTVALLLIVLAPVATWAASEGRVVIAQGVDPTTLDMMHQQEQPASNVGAQMFESLVERDVNLKLVPALAVELPKLVAPTTWQVKLRRGVKFHNGEDFNAESVKFSIERLANPANKLRGSSSFAPIDRVEIVDPYTVKIHTKKPWPVFPSHIALRQAAMYPPKEYAGKDPAAISKSPIGTGPYKFVRWSKDEEIVMEAFPGYWGGPAKIKTVVFKPIPDDAVRVAALQNGEIDVAVNIPPHLAGIIEKHPKIYLSTAPSIRTIQLMIYTHQMDPATHKATGPYAGPTADKRVRQALAYAIDADEIIKGVMDGKAVRVATMLPSLHFGYDASLKPIKQDLARSKKLLAEAGFPNGVEIVLNGPQGRYVRDKEVAEAVTGQLNKAGIKTTLKTYEFVSYLNTMVYVHKAGPVWLIGWGHPTMDAEAIYVPLFKSPGIFVNWNNEDFNGMVEQAQTQMDEKKRYAEYQRINKLWIEEVPAIPLYQQIDLYGANKRLVWKARSDELIRAYDMALR